jgi:lysylphosphatidylglycerol synthetase-like protein (DUF2156 family)
VKNVVIFGYDPKITVKKALSTAAQVAVGLAAADVAANGAAGFLERLANEWPFTLIPLILGVIRAVENLRKNARPNGVLWRWPWEK